MATVWFVGAGPGSPDLITVRGRDLLSRAGAILYAGSLVSSEHLKFAPENSVIADSSSMTLDEMTAWILQQSSHTDTIIRLQTGDPAIYGALAEMAQPLLAAGLTVKSVPGVPSSLASAATALETLTLPETTQTIILTRVEGRTPMPPGESLQELASHGSTLCIHLSINLLPKIHKELTAAGWAESAPVLVVHKASWPGEEKILRGTLGDIEEICRTAKLKSQSMIIVSPALGACQKETTPKSKLYNPTFGHGFRKASKEGL
ncbi:MAG: precorrin-4 C(11)-methyltransferase [Magnetococcales bacterium]|nr:precorrin-4 C(11)-methyltransferase [Magnetococcales bacterium]